MEFTDTVQHGSVAVITLKRGKANPLNERLVQDIGVSLEDAENDGSVTGIVLASASSRFFSSGFDVEEVFAYDRPAMAAFFRNFIGVFRQIAELPKPVVASMEGASFAGGSLLALACDFRVMAEENTTFCLNEIDLGIVLTPKFVRSLVDIVGLGAAREILLGGESVTSRKAYEIGLANEVTKNDVLLDRAIAWARTFGEKPTETFGAIKRMIGETTGISDPYNDGAVEHFLDHWFSAEALERKKALQASLRK